MFGLKTTVKTVIFLDAFASATMTFIQKTTPPGHPSARTLAQALKVALLYHRYNLTEELLAEVFTVSQPTISQAVNTIEKHSKRSSSHSLNKPLKESLKAPGALVVDGTLVSAWN